MEFWYNTGKSKEKSIQVTSTTHNFLSPKLLMSLVIGIKQVNFQANYKI